MTLAELGMLFWHDLAAPIAVGIITSAILSSWHNRK
ncbi:type I toxin-antitoxin system toxin Ldr family protein [Kluyvera sp. 142486]